MIHRILLSAFTFLSVIAKAQTDTVPVFILRTDTVHLTVAQHDSLQGLRGNYGMHIWGDSTHRDTAIRIGDKEYFPEELPEWFRNYIIGIWGPYCRTFVIHYDSTHVSMIYTECEGRRGSYSEYYPNGQLKVKGQYCQHDGDKKYGLWFYYKQDGLLKRSKMYRGGKYCTD